MHVVNYKWQNKQDLDNLKHFYSLKKSRHSITGWLKAWVTTESKLQNPSSFSYTIKTTKTPVVFPAFLFILQN